MTRDEKIYSIRNHIANRKGTMKQLAAQYDVSVSTLYRFDSDTASLSDSLLDDVMRKLGAVPAAIPSAQDEEKYNEFIRQLVKAYGSAPAAVKLGITQGTMYGYKKQLHRLSHALPKMLRELKNDPEAYKIAEDVYFTTPAVVLPPPPASSVTVSFVEHSMLPVEEQLPPPPEMIQIPVQPAITGASNWVVVKKDELASKLVYGKRFLLKALDDQTVLMQVEA